MKTGFCARRLSTTTRKLPAHPCGHFRPALYELVPPGVPTPPARRSAQIYQSTHVSGASAEALTSVASRNGSGTSKLLTYTVSGNRPIAAVDTSFAASVAGTLACCARLEAQREAVRRRPSARQNTRRDSGISPHPMMRDAQRSSEDVASKLESFGSGELGVRALH